MTSKEKAKEIVDKYSTYVVMWAGGIETSRENVKQCALIAVQFARENPLNTEGYNKYLDEIKQELIKL